jgi:glycerol uptake facilitator-like aquaporin
MDHLTRFAAELFGTFTLCAIAILAMAGVAQGDAGRIIAATVYGLGVVAGMHACGSLGPVHLNPAVTLAIFATGRGSFVRVLACVAGQLLGACLAGLLVMWLLAGEGTAMGMPMGSFTKTDAVKTVVVEGLLAMVWSAVFLGCVFGGRLGAAAALPIGLSVVAAALAGLPFTGAAMNPARALASAVAMLDFSTLWMYVAGPLAGAAVAGLVARVFLVNSSESAARRG